MPFPVGARACVCTLCVWQYVRACMYALRLQVALLGQKRAVAVMCCQKIACFEALRFHETAADQLKVLNETVGEGNTELLQGERTVTDTQSSIVRKHRGSNDGGGNGEDDDEYEEVEPAASSSSSQGSNGGAASAVQRDVKYPFQMALPPPGTHCFEDDLVRKRILSLCNVGVVRKEHILLCKQSSRSHPHDTTISIASPFPT